MASDIERLRFLRIVSFQPPDPVSCLSSVYTLRACVFQWTWHKEEWGSWEGRNYKNQNKKGGVCWTCTIASNWQERSCSPQKQRDLGKALCFFSSSRCLLMLAFPVRTRFVHRALGSLTRHTKDCVRLGASITSGRSTSSGIAIRGKCLAFPLCPISLLAVLGADATSFLS